VSVKRPAVVLGLSPGGLSLVRTLSRSGIPVYGVSRKKESGIFSKYIDHQRRWKCTDSEELVMRIIALSKETGTRPVLMPVSDIYVEWISEHYQELEAVSDFSKSYAPGQYIKFLDKDIFYEACEKTEVPYPKRVKLFDYAPAEIGELLGSPVLIKPGRLHEVTEIMGSRKVFICSDMRDIERYYSRLPKGRGEWLAQEIVVGSDTDIFCLGGVHTGGGIIESSVSGRKLRQFPSGYGTASAIILEKAPEKIWDYSKELLSFLDADGVFEIEFKRDQKDGLWKVFEINPRTALWFGAAEKADIPLALTTYHYYTGELYNFTIHNSTGMERSYQKISYQRTVIWRTGLKNLISIITALRTAKTENGSYSLKESKRMNKQVSSWAIWDADDPLPAIMELIGYIRKVYNRIGRRIQRGLNLDE